ncbi:MAG: helix-turn-helix domain-containing protein [Nitrospinota bacterium]
MLWTVLLRTSIVISLVAAVKQIYDKTTYEISPSRIYNTGQVSRFLGIDRKDVIKLIKSKKITAKAVNGNYKIPGQCILDYLNK